MSIIGLLSYQVGNLSRYVTWHLSIVEVYVLGKPFEGVLMIGEHTVDVKRFDGVEKHYDAKDHVQCRRRHLRLFDPVGRFFLLACL